MCCFVSAVAVPWLIGLVSLDRFCFLFLCSEFLLLVAMPIEPLYLGSATNSAPEQQTQCFISSRLKLYKNPQFPATVLLCPLATILPSNLCNDRRLLCDFCFPSFSQTSHYYD
jgi:hypothetical protein